MTEETDKELKRLGLARARPVGKKMGTKLYVHRLYEAEVVPADILARAKACGERVSYRVMRDYVGVKYDTKTQDVSFQTSDNFDTADEPLIGYGVSVKARNGVITGRLRPGNVLWHHKWLWVKDDYKGFDVEASKKRSLRWVPWVQKGEFARIGIPRVWSEIRKRWESV